MSVGNRQEGGEDYTCEKESERNHTLILIKINRRNGPGKLVWRLFMKHFHFSLHLSLSLYSSIGIQFFLLFRLASSNEQKLAFSLAAVLFVCRNHTSLRTNEREILNRKLEISSIKWWIPSVSNSHLDRFFFPLFDVWRNFMAISLQGVDNRDRSRRDGSPAQQCLEVVESVAWFVSNHTHEIEFDEKEFLRFQPSLECCVLCCFMNELNLLTAEALECCFVVIGLVCEPVSVFLSKTLDSTHKRDCFHSKCSRKSEFMIRSYLL